MSEISIFRGVDFTGTDWGRRNIDIAAGLGIDPALVAQARQHFGMVMKPRADWSGVDWTKSNKEIAEKLGVSYPAVARMRAEMGMTRGAIDWDAANWELSDLAIARELGCSQPAVSKKRRELFGEGSRAKPGRKSTLPPEDRKAERSSRMVSILFSAEESAALTAAAEAAGMTRPAYARKIVAEALKSSGSASL